MSKKIAEKLVRENGKISHRAYSLELLSFRLRLKRFEFLATEIYICFAYFIALHSTLILKKHWIFRLSLKNRRMKLQRFCGLMSKNSRNSTESNHRSLWPAVDSVIFSSTSDRGGSHIVDIFIMKGSAFQLLVLNYTIV